MKKIIRKLVLVLLIIEIMFIVINFWTLVEKMSFDLCGRECYVIIDEKNESYIKEIHSDSIVIDKINIKVPVIFNSGITEEEILNNLDNGAVFYPGSNLPSEKGLVIILGHSSNYWWNESAYNNVFTLLPELQKGDEIKIFYNNREYKFQVTSDKVLNINKWSEIKNPDLDSGLLLVTCWPIGTNWQRYVVYAEKI